MTDHNDDIKYSINPAGCVHFRTERIGKTHIIRAEEFKEWLRSRLNNGKEARPELIKVADGHTVYKFGKYRIEHFRYPKGTNTLLGQPPVDRVIVIYYGDDGWVHSETATTLEEAQDWCLKHMERNAL